LGGEPVPALLQNVRAPLLLACAVFLLNVTPWRSKKRQSTETEKSHVGGKLCVDRVPKIDARLLVEAVHVVADRVAPPST